MYRPVLITAPTIKPITLTEAKAWADITYTDKDTVITMQIAAETAHLDGWSGILARCLCEQTWRQDYDLFARCLRIPLAPVISITSVKYDDSEDVERTVAAEDYDLLVDDLGPYVKFLDTYAFPSLADERPAVRVTYLAGYGDIAGSPKTSSVPDDIKQYIAARIRARFDKPDEEPPETLDGLIAKHRRVRF